MHSLKFCNHSQNPYFHSLYYGCEFASAKPGADKGLVEFRVYNEEDRSISDENWKSVKIDTDANGLAKLISHPIATAEYLTGANEDTRMNISMFVFTDVYRYEVWASLPIDSLERYQQDIQDWFESAQFVEH